MRSFVQTRYPGTTDISSAVHYVPSIDSLSVEKGAGDENRLYGPSGRDVFFLRPGNETQRVNLPERWMNTSSAFRGGHSHEDPPGTTNSTHLPENENDQARPMALPRLHRLPSPWSLHATTWHADPLHATPTIAVDAVLRLLICFVFVCRSMFTL